MDTATRLVSHHSWCQFFKDNGACDCAGYKPSAREAFDSAVVESLKIVIAQETAKQENHSRDLKDIIVEDFKGAVDGKGIKNVMFASKTPLQLLTPEFLEGVAAVLQHGAQKYAPNNWMRGMSWETVMGGVLRHLTAFRRGEEMDPESKLPHLHHAACGIMFLSWYAHGPQSEHMRFDDRQYLTNMEEF